MSIHRTLLPGLEAYNRGDFDGARTAWEVAWQAVEGDERELALGLTQLAAALHHERSGHHETSAPLYTAARRHLAPLPPRLLGVDVAGLREALPAAVSTALDAPPPLAATRRIPRRVVVRFVALFLLVGSGFLAFRFTPLASFLDREVLTAFLLDLRQSWWAPFGLVALYAVLCPLGVPASPLILGGGFVFGTLWGGLLNLVGNFLGAALSFALGRLLGRDFIVHIAGERLRKVEGLLTRQGFWSLVRIRFIPIPFPVVNYGAALAGIGSGRFLLSTAVGLTPAVMIYTWFAASLSEATRGQRGPILAQLAGGLLALLALTFLPKLVLGWRRRRRYREVLARRRRRTRR